MKISIIGIGRLGGALAIALSANGCEIENLVARNTENSKKIIEVISQKPRILKTSELEEISSEIILITTQDSEIETVAESLSRSLKVKPFVFHTSGSLSSENLQKLKADGCPVGSIHPLVSVSDSLTGAKHFRDVYFCLEGETTAVEKAKELVEILGGKPFSIETRYKTLYHAAAVAACGHLVAVIDVALEMLQKCDLSEEDAREILLPLIKSTIENLETQRTEQALTGTFARADAETLSRQIDVLSKNVSNEIFEIFLLLGARSLRLAEAQGASPNKISQMREMISLAKTNFKC